MKNPYKKNQINKNERQAKAICKRLVAFNIICAGLLLVAFFMYFCDFFKLDIDGSIENKISGFKLSFILSGNSLNDSSNVLSLLNKKNPAKISFAAISSCLAMFSLIGLMGLFVYRAVKRQPLLSKLTLAFISVVFVTQIMQVAACGALASFVEEQYYATCATCLAQTQSFLPLIFFITMIIVYFCLAYYLYYKYTVAFKNPLAQPQAAQSQANQGMQKNKQNCSADANKTQSGAKSSQTKQGGKQPPKTKG